MDRGLQRIGQRLSPQHTHGPEQRGPEDKMVVSDTTPLSASISHETGILNTTHTHTHTPSI